MWLFYAGIVVGSFILSFLLTAQVRKYAILRGILDVPNSRSSHTRVTPRGGGLAIAVLILPGTALAGATGLAPVPVVMAVCGGGLLVAAIGWLDDRRGVPSRWRMLAHLVAAVWAGWWLGGMPRLDYGSGELAFGALGSVVAVIALAWMTNLYNFMDGIDGIAASEAVMAGLAAGVLLLAKGNAGLASLSFLVAGAAAGFLAWNWPPARIFMGDVGSGLLGFVFGSLALATAGSDSMPVLIWALLLGVFVVDATATLLRRVLKGERWYEAHRSHAYQVAVRSGYSHRQVTLTVIAIDIALVLAAGLASRWPVLLLPVGLGAAVVLVGLWGRVVANLGSGSGTFQDP